MPDINGVEDIRSIFDGLTDDEKDKVNRYSILITRKALLDKWINEITDVFDDDIDYNDILNSLTGKGTKPAKNDIMWVASIMIQWKQEVDKEIKEIEEGVLRAVSMACCFDWLKGVYKRIVPAYSDRISEVAMEEVLNKLNIPFNDGTKHMYIDVCKNYIESIIATSKNFEEKDKKEAFE